jgi:transposase
VETGLDGRRRSGPGLERRTRPGPGAVRTTCAETDRETERGPAAAGWAEDQRWTLAGIRTLIGRIFHITVSIATVSQILHRAGFTPKQPIQRAAERDETAIEHWRRYHWLAVKDIPAA